MRLIDADELIPLIKMGEMNTYSELGEGRNGGIAFAIERINQMPTIEPKKGKWGDFWKCSICEKQFDIGIKYHMNFCPNCGADMRVIESEE